MSPSNPSPTPTLAITFPEWLPSAENTLCHRALSLIPMTVLCHFYQLGRDQFGAGGILIEDWTDDRNPCLSYQTVESLAETLVLTHIFRYGEREAELLRLLLEHPPETPLVVVVYRRSSGSLIQVQVRTDLVSPVKPITTSWQQAIKEGDRVQFDGVTGTVTAVTRAGSAVNPFRIFTVAVDQAFWGQVSTQSATVTEWHIQAVLEPQSPEA